jgi:CHAT domain-containing protein/predicted hydrocarbon binding protein
MSRRLANKLMMAESASAFLRKQGGKVNWQSFSALKLEVDRLAHSDLNQATRLVERIEQLAALTKDSPGDAFAQASRARVLHLMGKHDEANHLYDSAAQLMRAAGLTKEAAIAQKQQVDALTHLGLFDKALRTARTARRVLARTEPVHHAQLEANVGNIYYLLDRYKKALAHYDLARDMLEKAGDARMRALVDMSRANVLTELDRPEEALALLANSARTLDRAGQSVVASLCRMHMAYLQFLRGNYNTGLKGYYETRDRLTSLGSLHHVAWCDLEIAEILLALNAFDDASESAARAREKFTELAMPYESARAQMTSALAAMGLGQFERALNDFMEARNVFAANRNTTFTALADSYLAELAIRRGRADEALIRAQSALRAFSRQNLVTKAAYSRLIAARALHLAGDQAKAKRGARAALASVEGRFAPSVVYMCHHLIGKIERDQGRSVEALASFRRAVETVEQMRGGIAADEFRASFLRDKVEVYEDAVSACLDDGGSTRLEEAFKLVESSKSRALADLLARYVRSIPETGSGSQKQRGDGKTRARLLKLIEDLNWYSSHANIEDERGEQRSSAASDRYASEVARCEREIASLFRRVESDGSVYDEIERMQAVTANEFRAALDDDETAIEYFTTGDELSAFVISRDRITVVRHIASKREVERMLAALRFQLEKFNYGSGYADEHFEQLNGAANYHLALIYRTVFARLEQFVQSQRLIIIPHGALHYVPFHALLSRRGYLVDQFEISYAPSATVLKLCRARGNQYKSSNVKSEILKSKLIALGVAERQTPSIEAEIRALRNLFPDSITFTGRDATRENLLKFAPAARFLHLASHGHFRRDNPMFSFLKLADSPLNFYSLMDLKLKAEMVTLSACHTGVNMVFPGDELHGLMRGFLYAGAPSLVASLWAANDISTAEFMKEMYSQIRAGASKRAALRSAQLAVKDAYGHPYYWAPFILMGNPN